MVTQNSFDSFFVGVENKEKNSVGSTSILSSMEIMFDFYASDDDKKMFISEYMKFVRTQNEENDNNKNNRKLFSKRIYYLVIGWLILTLLIIIAKGISDAITYKFFSLSESVIITLLTTTTANIIAMLLIIMRYLFPPKKVLA